MQAIIDFLGCRISTGDTFVTADRSFNWSWLSLVSSVCLDVFDKSSGCGVGSSNRYTLRGKVPLLYLILLDSFAYPEEHLIVLQFRVIEQK